MSYAQLAESLELTSENMLLGLGKQHILYSETLKEDRPFVVSTPLGYTKGKSNYPVIYVLDGLENIKHTVGTIELLTSSGIIPPMIIVAVQSLDRARDLTPSNAGQNVYGGTGNAGIPQSGGAPNFLQFIEKELIPYVEANFRTHPYRILEGHSFGGLFSVYALMNRPSVFNAYIIEAPALWWNKEEMTAEAKEFFATREEMNKTVYLGIGAEDGWGMRQELLRYVDVFKEHEPLNFKWKHEEIAGEDHMSSRLLLNYYGLKFLFSDLKLGQIAVDDFNDEVFSDNEQRLMNKYGTNARRPAGDYMNLVMQLVEKENKSGAITVLNRAVEAYPMYLGMLTYLAKLYIQTDQTDKAIETYLAGIDISKKYKLGKEDDLMIEINKLKM